MFSKSLISKTSSPVKLKGVLKYVIKHLSINLLLIGLYIEQREAKRGGGRDVFFVNEQKIFFNEGPETLTIEIAPTPGGVAIAAIG